MIGTSINTNRYTGDGDHPGCGALVGHQACKLGDLNAVANVNRINAEANSMTRREQREPYRIDVEV